MIRDDGAISGVSSPQTWEADGIPGHILRCAV